MIDLESLPSSNTAPDVAYERITGRRLPFDRQKEMVFTYAISDGEFIKIGRADHLRRRISSLQTANARVLKLLGFRPFDIERDVQRCLRLNRSHVHGEWFVDNESVRDLLRTFNLIGAR